MFIFKDIAKMESYTCPKTLPLSVIPAITSRRSQCSQMQEEIGEKIEPIQAEKQQARQQAKKMKSEAKQARSKLKVRKV